MRTPGVWAPSSQCCTAMLQKPYQTGHLALNRTGKLPRVNISLGCLALFNLWTPHCQTLRFVCRGRAASKDDADFDVSGNEGDVDDLRNWLDDPGKGPAWEAFQPDSKKVTKYPSPGTVTDLFTHYQATRQLYGGTAVSYLCGPLIKSF